jgi:hypothetical protein
MTRTNALRPPPYKPRVRCDSEQNGISCRLTSGRHNGFRIADDGITRIP